MISAMIRSGMSREGEDGHDRSFLRTTTAAAPILKFGPTRHELYICQVDVNLSLLKLQILQMAPQLLRHVKDP